MTTFSWVESVLTSAGPALVGAVSAIAIKYFSDMYIGRLKDYKARRLELAIKRSDEQIGKFYAPLVNYVEQLRTIASLKDSLVNADRENSSSISKFMYDEYFSPIHKKIGQIIEQNLHLIEGDKIPPSFVLYNEHVASESVFFSIKDKPDVIVNFSPYPYPPQFYWDIKNGFARAIARQEIFFGMLDKEFEEEGFASPKFQSKPSDKEGQAAAIGRPAAQSR